MENYGKMEDGLLVPKRVTIETIYACNFKCVFCPHGNSDVVNSPDGRKRSIMPMDLFKYILDNLSPYVSEIDNLSLFGLGEPTMDPHIVQRVKYAKELGFSNVGFATNAQRLTEDLQKDLLDAGIDTIIFSIDGYKKETHEKLRKGAKFEDIISNVENIINLRNAGNYKTRFIVRFIIQEANSSEWDDYYRFWSEKLSRERRDKIIQHPLHNWAGQTSIKKIILSDNEFDVTEGMSCHHYTDILYILSDGTVPLCHEDNPNPKYIFGKIGEKTPLEIFNSEKRKTFNKLHNGGKKSTIDICKNCTILFCESKRRKFEPSQETFS